MLQDESGQVIEERPRPAGGPGILEQAKGFVGLSPRGGAASGTTGAAQGPIAESRGPPATQVRHHFRSSWALVVCMGDTTGVLQWTTLHLHWALPGSS